jgi:hypothetical protein
VTRGLVLSAAGRHRIDQKFLSIEQFVERHLRNLQTAAREIVSTIRIDEKSVAKQYRD